MVFVAHLLIQNSAPDMINMGDLEMFFLVEQWLVGASIGLSIVYSTFFGLFLIRRVTPEDSLASKRNATTAHVASEDVNQVGQGGVFSKPNRNARFGVKCQVCGDTHYVPNAGVYSCPNMTRENAEFDARRNMAATSSDDYLVGFVTASAISDCGTMVRMTRDSRGVAATEATNQSRIEEDRRCYGRTDSMESTSTSDEYVTPISRPCETETTTFASDTNSNTTCGDY